MGGSRRTRATSAGSVTPAAADAVHEENDVTTPPVSGTPSEADTAGGYLVANGVTRAEADRLRRIHADVVVSRNLDGTFRVTRSLRD